MPTTYAHYKLGQAVRAAAPVAVRQIIDAYPQLFSIGLHGPDILFYHKPFQSNPVMKLGYDIHERPGYEFFSHARDVLKAHPKRADYLAYAYGFLCHFGMDVTCHGYVNQKEAASSITHAEIEAEFDRMLLVKDGLDPVRTPLDSHIVASRENAQVIKDFYEGITVSEAFHAILGAKFYHRLLLAPSKLKRSILFCLLKLVGRYDKMRGLFINYKPNPACSDSNARLMELFDESKKLVLELLDNFARYLDNTAPLAPVYQFDFDGKDHTKE